METKIKQLRPTQAVYGLREVQQKARGYEELEGHHLRMVIAEKPIPVVLGPKEELYIIDHHHIAAALWSIAVESVPYVLERDLSSLSVAEFWFELEERRWTHPYDRDGRRIAFQEMPETLVDLEDDEFRSLAAAVRDEGGYEKSHAALAEFRWADFFRERLIRPTTDAEFRLTTKEAIKIAKSKVAMGLPGFLG